MVTILVAMAIALIAISYVPMLPTLSVLLILIGALTGLSSLMGLIWSRRMPTHSPLRGLVQSVSQIAAGSIIGAGLGWSLCSNLINNQFPEHYNGQVLQLYGTVSSMPQASSVLQYGDGATQWQFDFRVKQAYRLDADQGSAIPSILNNLTVKLTWIDRGDTAHDTALQPLAPGMGLRLSARLKTPRGLANPRGFDYQRWLLSSGYSATGSVKSIDGVVHLSTSLAHRLFDGISSIRFAVYRQYQRYLSDDAMLGPILAIAIGHKADLTDQQWSLLETSGTIHLLIVSGLHIGLIAGVGFWFGLLIARFFCLTNQKRVLLIPVVLSLMLSGFYAALAGFSLPTQRALVMVVIGNLYWLFGRSKSPWVAFWSAMIFVLIIDPLAGHGSGFWLSFSVVFIILLVSPSVNYDSWFKQAGKLQLAIFAGMLVPIAWTTGTLNLLAPAVNIVAIPFVSLVVVPLVLLTSCISLLAVDPLVEWMVDLSVIAMSLFWYGTQLVVDRLDFSNAPVLGWLNQLIASANASYGYWSLLLLTSFAALIPVLPRSLKALALVAAVLGLACVPLRPPTLRLTVLDVGQGSANVLQLGHQTLVFDSGPRFSDHFRAAQDVVAPYLNSMGVDKIDLLVISHGDADHASDSDFIQHQFQPIHLYSGEPDRLPVSSKRCVAGDPWQWGDAWLQFLWPVEFHSRLKSSNDHSCVLLVRWQGQYILFTGDISKPVEWYLVEQFSEPVSVLLAPHHGSKTSSSHRFVANLSPKHVVFSTGFGNRYRHPNEAVVARYETLTDAEVWNTAEHGAIVFEWTDDQILSVKGYRDWRQRLWY